MKLTFLLLFFTLVIEAQDTVSIRLSHANPVDARTIEPIRLFEMRMTYKNKPIESKSEFSIQTHLGNTWNPMVAVDYLSMMPNQTRPLYNEEPGRYKVYSADGVIRSAVLRYTKKIKARHEITSTLTFFQLMGGDNLIDRPASDNFIEWIHDLSMKNPFGRLDNPLNRGKIIFIDRNSNRYQINEGQMFLGTFDISHIQYKDLIIKKGLLLSMSLSESIGIPLSQMNSHIAAGIIFSSALSFAINDQHTFTTSIALLAQHNKSIKLLNQKYDFFDQQLSLGYRLMIAHSIDFKNSARYTTSLELQGITTSALSSNAKGPISTDWIDPTGEYLGQPYTLEKYPESIGTAHPKSNIDRSNDSLTLGTEYLSANFTYRFGKEGKSPSLSLYLQEDWKLFVANSDGIKLFYGGTNAQDFGLGLKLLYPLHY